MAPSPHLKPLHINTRYDKLFRGLGIHTISDLLQYFPSRYLDFSKTVPISQARLGENITILGTIKQISTRPPWSGRLSLTEAIVSDQSGSLKIIWFNQPYLAKSLSHGETILLAGKVGQFKGLQMQNPIFEKLTQNPSIHTGRLVPVYRLPTGLFPKPFRKIIYDHIRLAKNLPETLPQSVLNEADIWPLGLSIQTMHFPSTLASLDKAKERLAFEEIFIHLLAAQIQKQHLESAAAPSVKIDIEYLKHLISRLPFTLTTDQKQALWEIVRDLATARPMQRLLQGDVGSGKTVVALLASLTVAKAGWQTVLLAPTEILALQHFNSFQNLIGALSPASPHLGLFTQSFHQLDQQTLSKPKFIKALTAGDMDIVIGTHALLAPQIIFKRLALTIVDEQQRFGVKQRQALTKIQTNPQVPHLLSMTATPIPRTAALTLYGDLKLSVIKEKPQQRLEVKTWLVPEHKRAGAYDFIKQEAASGRQTFIITPLIEESDSLSAKAAAMEQKRLETGPLSGLRIGLLHGGLKGAQKDKIMGLFQSGQFDVLVATTVVEIGIDIPSATVIVIENAERFGLAQLHQLRGRVGRRDLQSYCLLFSDNQAAQERLQFFTATWDGFKLAEYDMKDRGFGSLFGQEQSGFQFRYGQYLTLKVLRKAKQAALSLINSSQLSKYPALASKAMAIAQELHLE